MATIRFIDSQAAKNRLANIKHNQLKRKLKKVNQVLSSAIILTFFFCLIYVVMQSLG